MKIDPKVPSQLNDWMTEDTSSYPEGTHLQDLEFNCSGLLDSFAAVIMKYYMILISM